MHKQISCRKNEFCFRYDRFGGSTGFPLDARIPGIENILGYKRVVGLNVKDGTVAGWCFTQREMRKSGKLTKERIRKLDETGFI